MKQWEDKTMGGMLGKNFLDHQFKSGHFQCKTQIRQINWVGAPHKGPNPHSPYIVVSVSVDQKLDFWILSETISRDHTFESLCCTDFKNVTLYLIYTPWKLLHYFKCWAKNNSPKGNLAIAFHLQTRHSLKLLNSSGNGTKTSFDSKRHYFAISFWKISEYYKGLM